MIYARFCHARGDYWLSCSALIIGSIWDEGTLTLCWQHTTLFDVRMCLLCSNYASRIGDVSTGRWRKLRLNIGVRPLMAFRLVTLLGGTFQLRRWWPVYFSEFGCMSLSFTLVMDVLSHTRLRYPGALITLDNSIRSISGSLSVSTWSWSSTIALEAIQYWTLISPSIYASGIFGEFSSGVLLAAF